MGVCDVPVMDKVCGAVEFAANPAGKLTDGIGAWIAKSMGELAQAAAGLATKAVDSTTAINLNAHWFRDNYELLLPIGLTVTVGTFCLQLTLAAWRRDERALAQAVTGTVVGVFFAFAAISLTTIALTVVDALSAGLFQVADSSVDDAIRRLIRVSQYGNLYQDFNWAAPALIALGAAISAFLYWGVMLFRKVGILVLVALAVFAGAGGGWEVARRWRRGWIEATATLVVSKLLMTIVFLIGVSAMGRTDSKDGTAALSDAMAGIVILILVLLCPYATYKFIHWAADGGNGADLHRTSMAGVATAAGAAKTAGTLAARAGTGTPAPQGPAKIPGADGSGVVSGITPSGPEEPKATHFRYGEDNNAGDKGRGLIRRPPTTGDKGQALIRGSGQGAPAASPSPSSTAAAGSGGSVVHGGPSTSGPSPHGGAVPEKWVFGGSDESST